MPVEFIGIARTADRPETIAEAGPAVQPEYLYHLAATHEQSGFDHVLVAHSSSSPEGATTLLIRGYDPLQDAAAYADLIRLVHDQVGEDIDSYRARVAA